MKIAIYGTLLLLGLSLGCLGANGGAMAPKRPKVGITIRVLNPASVPDSTLRKAEQMAAAVLDAAGVGITWLECPCPRDLRSNEFWLHLLKNRPPRMRGDTTGFAVLMPARDGAVSYAGVVWPAVEEVASSLESDLSDVLGATVAHEIGHILLGSKAHTRSGIMCSRFQRADMRKAASGELRFTPEQAQRMQANVEQTALPLLRGESDFQEFGPPHLVIADTQAW
jgi:hypothetical protein